MRRNIIIGFLTVILTLLLLTCDLHYGKNNDEILDVISEGHYLLRLDNENFVAYYGGWVYTIEKDKSAGSEYVYRMYVNGTGREKISNSQISKSVFNDDLIYYMYKEIIWSDDWRSLVNIGSIYRMCLDGSQHMKYATTENVLDFTLNGDWIYYLSSNYNIGEDGRSLYRIRIDGSENHLIMENCAAFIISDEYIFTGHKEFGYENMMTRCNLDGTGKEVFFEKNIVI